MKTKLKRISLVISTVVALSACDSASSDAKRVDVTPTAPIAIVDKAKTELSAITDNLIAKTETAPDVNVAKPVVTNTPKYVKG